jgi:Arc/MetJ family transcription regulator
MKRTNIVLDEKLLDRGKRLTGLKTTRGLVEHALRELVRRKNQRRILQLKGKVEWQGDLARMRSTRGVS